MQYRAQYMLIFLRKKKKIVILFKKPNQFSRIMNKDPSKTEKKVCFHPACWCLWLLDNVLQRALY